MDEYSRHLKLWHALYAMNSGWITRKFNMTHEDLHVDGPALIVPNHVSAWDPLLVAMSLRDKQAYFVASEHLFRMGPVSKLLEFVVAPIPRRKASTGTDTVKACLRHLREGHSICLFAEGEQSWNGRNIPIFPATGKLVKSSGATLVTYRLEGAYLSLPRWGKGVRRGRVYGHPVGIYPPEQLKSLTPKEINALIERDTAEDAWERQRLSPVRYIGKHRAEGLERALYLCPRCRRIGSLHTNGNRIFCDCGLDLEYTETGFFSPEQPFSNLAEWDDWQREKLSAREFNRPAEDGLLFSDGGITLTKIGSGHSEEQLGAGALQMYEDRLVCAGHSFPLSEISYMADVLASRLLLTVNGEYYEILSSNGVSFRKYLEIWRKH
ncbi:MAG: 1-acyl-sn-glycerol-3-phosphate acyltransferase [Oscillospiraceae bacterium]|nr:1-acyl-sn-glycerol-3-phosphate acyltransferase [Oscillospiraceae bacterium]